LPLSCQEVYRYQADFDRKELILSGFYPEVIAKKRNPKLWFSSYIRTYIERDIRQIKQIENSLLFQKFIRLCAGRIGQQLNIVSLSTDCGINVRTAQSWLSILESTYVIHLLQPYYENFNKRLVKSPKLYFCDSGLACSLLNIKTKDELEHSHFFGALFENFIIIDFIKNAINFQTDEKFYYWRDNNGVEIDMIKVKGNHVLPIEIKSGETFSNDFLKNLKKFNSYSGISNGLLLYNGSTSIQGSDGIDICNWKNYLMSTSND
jgi:predicted AAA+ superfamily ATPase